MKEYLREARRKPEARELFSRRPGSAKKRDSRIVKKQKAVKFFQQRQPAIYRAGEG
jgi:hypothetical protein